MAWVGLTLRAVGHFVFRFRDWLSPLALAVVLLSARASDFIVGRTGRILAIAGIALIVVGTMIRIGVAGYGTVRRSGVNKRISASRLVTDGLYAHTRNPLYLANIMTLGGLAALYGSSWLLFAGLPLLIVLILTLVSAEEEFLARRFGNGYPQYRRRVRRFRPRLSGLWRTLATTPFDPRRAIRREYGTVFAIASVAIVLVARRQIAIAGVATSQPVLSGLLLVWVGCTAAYLGVRWLKKTKRLETYVPPPAEVSAAALPDPR